ncbi:MAG TPA: hypothetical protein VIV11_28175 [Kofleriaceae bacterium]
MRWTGGVLVVASLAACSFERGTAAGDGRPPEDGASNGDTDGMPSEAGTPGGFAYVGHTIGKSSTGTVTIASPLVPSATYVVGVVSKSFEAVAAVNGLGATWTRVADQCGARSQTGVSIYIGRGATVAGNVVVTMEAEPINTIAVVAIYKGSSITGTFAMYNALDASTCNASSTSVDINVYSFAIAASHPVIAAVATRAQTHIPGTGLTQRVQDFHGSSGDVAGLAMLDGQVTTVAGGFSSETDVAVIAVELRP